MFGEPVAEETRERYRGCLPGGSVDDTLGAMVEFMPRSRILERFGPAGGTDHTPIYRGVGRITDDAQMTPFTAEGLLCGWIRSCLRRIAAYSDATTHAYLRRMQTQGVIPKHDIVLGTDGTDGEPGWLIRQSALHHWRAPGNTGLPAWREMPARGSSQSLSVTLTAHGPRLFAPISNDTGSPALSVSKAVSTTSPA